VWQTLGFSNTLVFDRVLQHHAIAQLVDVLTVDFLPWGLALWILVAAAEFQLLPPLLEFLVGDQDMGRDHVVRKIRKKNSSVPLS